MGHKAIVQVDIVSSNVNSSTNVDVDIQVSNSHSYPVHVMDIELSIEDAAERKATTTRVRHSCIVKPFSSKMVNVPLNLNDNVVPYMLKANLNIKDKVHGVYQVSTERVRQMFNRGLARKTRNNPSPPRLNGLIEGINIQTYYPKEVLVSFDVQVKNANFLPLKLMHTEFEVQSGGKVITTRKVTQNTSVPRKTTSKVKITLPIPMELILGTFPGIRGYPLPIDMDIKFWFKEPFYGMYKVDAKKTGVLIIPKEPVVKIVRVAFGFEDNKPVARTELAITNPNTFDLDVKGVEYQAFSKETGSSLIRAKYYKGGESVTLMGNGSLKVVAVARPSSHEFGAVLWKLCQSDADYYVKTVIEAHTKSYGRIVFQT